jgi:hypothetical protein
MYTEGSMARVTKKVMLVGSANTKQSVRRRRVRNPATMAENATEEVVQINDGNTIFHLRKPIDLCVRRESRHFVVGYEPLGIEESGETEFEALRAFANHFGDIWQEIAVADDGQLTSDARQLKRRLQSLVQSVSTR